VNLIVFDLEWNIGYAPKTFDYHGAELTFRGEIVQIGAVRLDEQCRALDTFSLTLRPRIFPRLQRHVAQVTGLSQGDLDAGVPIAEGLRRFLAWAGPDAEFGEWGLDDVPVLKQNLFLCGLDESWPAHWYDLQRVFVEEFPRGPADGMTLESVIDRLGIPKDEPFHNALDDALYTVKVCRRLSSLMDALNAYPREDELLREGLMTDPAAQYYDFRTWYGRLAHDDYKTDPELCGAHCPVCGRPLAPQEIWLKRGNTGYYTRADCPVCGPWFLRFKLSRRDGLHWNFARCVEAVRPDTLQKWERQKTQMLERMRQREQKLAAAAAAK
jgi:inhibitor of KinA sporulation pathway (predicted exonuclease)